MYRISKHEGRDYDFSFKAFVLKVKIGTVKESFHQNFSKKQQKSVRQKLLSYSDKGNSVL